MGPSECETKFALKHFGMGFVKMHDSMAVPYMIFENGGVGLQIQSYLGFFLSQSTKIGVN